MDGGILLRGFNLLWLLAITNWLQATPIQEPASPVFGLLNQLSGEMIYAYEGDQIVVITGNREKVKGKLIRFTGDTLQVAVNDGLFSASPVTMSIVPTDINQLRISKENSGFTAVHYLLNGCNTITWTYLGLGTSALLLWIGTPWIIPPTLLAAAILHQLAYHGLLRIRYNVVKNNGDWLMLTPENMP